MKNNLNQSMARSCQFEGALAGCSAALSNIDQSLKKKKIVLQGQYYTCWKDFLETFVGEQGKKYQIGEH